MTNGALVIGWGPVVRGREQKALQLFNESIQYYARLQDEGIVESFEPVVLEPHGGDFQGFIFVRGDREKLNALRASEEFMHLTTRAELVLDNVGITNAYIGEELQRQLMYYQAQVSELS